VAKRKPDRKADKSPEPRRITVATNRRARHDYEIVDRFDAGIVLTGAEIKSVRAHRVQLQGAFGRVRNGEVWLEGMVIAPYENRGYTRGDPDRPRKLLLHRSQILRLASEVEQQGLTIVPLSVYINERGIAKVEIGLARGLRQYDKRQKIREREESRQVARAMRHAY
jgi:SsrA-binding protein